MTSCLSVTSSLLMVLIRCDEATPDITWKASHYFCHNLKSFYSYKAQNVSFPDDTHLGCLSSLFPSRAQPNRMNTVCCGCCCKSCTFSITSSPHFPLFVVTAGLSTCNRPKEPIRTSVCVKGSSWVTDKEAANPAAACRHSGNVKTIHHRHRHYQASWKSSKTGRKSRRFLRNVCISRMSAWPATAEDHVVHPEEQVEKLLLWVVLSNWLIQWHYHISEITS